MAEEAFSLKDAIALYSGKIERVLRNYFRERSRRKVHAHDLKRINAAAERLNLEAAEVLEYQAQLIEEGFLDCAT